MFSSQSHVCDFCKRGFTTKRSLSRHQLTAKYCTNRRNLSVEKKFECSYCQYGSYFKNDMDKHVLRCEKKDRTRQIDQFKKDLLVRDMKIEILEKMSERHSVSINNTNFGNTNNSNNTNTNTNNTNSNNTNITFNTLINHSMEILSPYEELVKKLPDLVNEHITYSKYRKNIDGITSALIEGILQNKNEKWLVCYEGSKQDFHEKKLGQIEIDQRAGDFFNRLSPLLENKIREFFEKEYKEAESDEKDEEKAGQRKRTLLKLCDASSLERKRCVKTIADSIYLSKNSVRVHNDRAANDLLPKITDKTRINYFRKYLPEYCAISSQISSRLNREFTIEKFLLGIPGFVEASKTALSIEGKISIIFFNSEFHIRDGEEIVPIDISYVIKSLTNSLCRLCEIHADDYLEQHPEKDVQELDLMRSKFKEIRDFQFINGKEVPSQTRQMFINLLAEELKISDDVIMNDI